MTIMDEKLQAFFNGARQKLGLPAPKNERAPSHEALTAALKDTAEAEFGGIIELLNGLPDDNGKFDAWINTQCWPRPAVMIEIGYTGALPESLMLQPAGDHGQTPRAEICLVLEMTQTTSTTMSLLNFAVLEDKPGDDRERSYKSEKPWSFDDARRALGKGIALIAPARVQELCDSAEAQPPQRIALLKQVRLKGSGGPH